MVLWLYSAAFTYPVRIESLLESTRNSHGEYRPQLNRSICFAPGLFYIDWQEGTEIFNASGFEGLILRTPWDLYLLTYRKAWDS
jgi:hypothetical protein